MQPLNTFTLNREHSSILKLWFENDERSLSCVFTLYSNGKKSSLGLYMSMSKPKVSLNFAFYSVERFVDFLQVVESASKQFPDLQIFLDGNMGNDKMSIQGYDGSQMVESSTWHPELMQKLRSFPFYDLYSQIPYLWWHVLPSE